MKLAEWARRNGVHPQTAYRWFREGTMPVPARRLASGTIMVEVADAEVAALNGGCEKFLGLLRDPNVTTIVVEHRDRFARFGAEYVEAALAAPGRRLMVVDPAEVDDDLVADVTQTLTSLCARLYGRRAAGNRAGRGVVAATAEDAG